VCAHELQVSDANFFDDLEKQAVQAHLFENIEYKPPHPVVVWMRILGLPLLNVYLNTTQKIKDSWQWFINRIVIKRQIIHHEKPSYL
jgi:hypothetical protein